MFHIAESIKSGSYEILNGKARQIVGGTASNADVDGRDPIVAALADGKVDVVIGYCTCGRSRMGHFVSRGTARPRPVWIQSRGPAGRPPMVETMPGRCEMHLMAET